MKKIERADKKAARAAAKRADHPVAKAVAVVGKFGDQPPLLALSAGVLAMGWWRGDRRTMRAGARMLAAEAVSIVLKDLVKRAVTRTRPHLLVDKGHYELRFGGPHDGPYNSFPSGHTAGAVAVSRALAREYPEGDLPAYAAAATIAVGQIPASAHYPTDITAGAAVGYISEWLVDQAVQAIDARLERAPHGAALGAGGEETPLVIEPVEQPERHLAIV
ncbi:phosphatase PAP2 family protein [Sphingoaurantiacus capsulatus]|uniref:Phosphatase PAP2 family protein n=1 Tax=Sphingoaurantiacus capsulatus TaxID=1771310 RepID=A0ABV7XEU9_9SPHN